MIQKLSHTCIWVLDQEKARDFYVNALGFEVRTDQKMGSFRWLTVGPKSQPELELVLMHLSPNSTPNLDPATTDAMLSLLQRGVLSGGVFETDNCRATYEQLKARGVEFREPPQERPYGTEAMFKDNSGNWFSLVQRPGK